jgi:hypothetical protein
MIAVMRRHCPSARRGRYRAYRTTSISSCGRTGGGSRTTRQIGHQGRALFQKGTATPRAPAYPATIRSGESMATLCAPRAHHAPANSWRWLLLLPPAARCARRRERGRKRGWHSRGDRSTHTFACVNRQLPHRQDMVK